MLSEAVAGRWGRGATLAVLGFGVVSCEYKTVTEELPTGTPDVRMTPVPVAPIGAVPGGLRPSSAPAPPGGSQPGPDGPTDPTDTGADIPDNTAPVVDVGAKMFFAECGGTLIEYPGYAPVGCRIHLDATAKDASRKPTQAKGSPRWSFSGDVGNVAVNTYTSYTPSVLGLSPASITAWCTIDGVESNPVALAFK